MLFTELSAGLVSVVNAVAKTDVVDGCRASAGVRVLVVEPLARRLAPWWDGWERGFTAAGGRADQWRLEEPLPETVALLGRAAGLDPTAVGARSLFLPARDREGRLA